MSDDAPQVEKGQFYAMNGSTPVEVLDVEGDVALVSSYSYALQEWTKRFESVQDLLRFGKPVSAAFVAEMLEQKEGYHEW